MRRSLGRFSCRGGAVARWISLLGLILAFFVGRPFVLANSLMVGCQIYLLQELSKTLRLLDYLDGDV